MFEQLRPGLAQARRAVFESYRRDPSNRWIEARGVSMRPLIAPGSWMLVEFGAMPEGVGEIVLFSLGDLIVAHRLVARRPGPRGLVTKGDAEPYHDRAIDAADVLGVVRALRRGPAGPISAWGCGGRSARLIARISRGAGRGAGAARRGANLLPDPPRRLALRAIPPLARVVAQALLAPFTWAAHTQIVRFQSTERG